MLVSGAALVFFGRKGKKSRIPLKMMVGAVADLFGIGLIVVAILAIIGK
jgi:hypothetical protein